MLNLLNVVFIFVVFGVFGQKKVSNFSELTRLTFGLHYTHYQKPDYKREFDINTAEFEQQNTKHIFIDYRILQYSNLSLNFGVFFNRFLNNLKYKGYVYDNLTNSYEIVDGNPYIFRENLKQLEFYLTLNYLVKYDSDLMINFGSGISREKNSSNTEYINQAFFSDESFTLSQLVYEDIYILRKDFYRYHFSSSLGYKNDVGLFNIGLKYSIPFITFLKGTYTFYDEGINNQNKEFAGSFKQSGEYLSLILSFTPSKNLFKKKK